MFSILMTIIFLSFIVDQNIVSYIWLSLVVSIAIINGLILGLVVSMSPLPFYYFYSLQSSYIIVVGLNIWYAFMVVQLGLVAGFLVVLLATLVYMGCVDGGLVWLGVGGMYFLGLSGVGVLVSLLLAYVYLANLSGLIMVTLVLSFPLTFVFIVKIALSLKLGVALIIVFSVILSYSLGAVGGLPPIYSGLAVCVSGLSGVLV